MSNDASEIARRLASQAEAVCRYYLPAGRRHGAYWLVGAVDNSPGRSLYVRLHPTSKVAAGKWTDAATGEHGDLLDLIMATRSFATLAEALDEARSFLSLPRNDFPTSAPPVQRNSPDAARRLFAASQSLQGTLAETYLRRRGLTRLHECDALRFHPHCFYRADKDDAPDAPEALPALIANVTALDGTNTGLQRTWLDPNRADKAQLATPRRSMGELHGHAVRIGKAGSVLAAGEGVETMLSLRVPLPHMPIAAALSAAHLRALILPAGLRRLYVVEDNDVAGRGASDSLLQRATDAGVEAIRLRPQSGDLNDDIRSMTETTFAHLIKDQIAKVDASI